MRWIPFASWPTESPWIRDATFVALRSRHHAIRHAWELESAHAIDVRHIVCEYCGGIIDCSTSLDALTIVCPSCHERLDLPPYMRGKGTWNHPIERQPIVWTSKTPEFIKGFAVGMLLMLTIVGIIATAIFVMALK